LCLYVRHPLHTQVKAIKMNSTVNMSRTDVLEMFKALGATLGYTAESLVMLEPKAEVAPEPKAEVTPEPKAEVAPEQVTELEVKSAKRMGLYDAWTKEVIAMHCPSENDRSEEFVGFLASRVADAEAGKILYNAKQANVKKGKRAVGDKMTAQEALVGAHIPFASFWRKEHPEQYSAFKAEWELTNSSPVTMESVDVKPTKRRGPKKLADMTSEERGVHEARKAERKGKRTLTFA